MIAGDQCTVCLRFSIRVIFPFRNSACSIQDNSVLHLAYSDYVTAVSEQGEERENHRHSGLSKALFYSLSLYRSQRLFLSQDDIQLNTSVGWERALALNWGNSQPSKWVIAVAPGLETRKWKMLISLKLWAPPTNPHLLHFLIRRLCREQSKQHTAERWEQTSVRMKNQTKQTCFCLFIMTCQFTQRNQSTSLESLPVQELILLPVAESDEGKILIHFFPILTYHSCQQICQFIKNTAISSQRP